MIHTMSPLSSTARAARLAAFAVLLAGAATGASAQYKIVGPDGSVTYTDKPPAAADARLGNQGVSGGSVGGSLPYEVRQAMSRYPVTLYAGKGCGPCDSARQYLKSHGVPFSEYSVETNADIEALKSRFGEPQLPVVTIGGQSMKGYASNDLQGYLDAAGYPKQAHLTGYSWPAATPLSPVKAIPAPEHVAQPAPAPAPTPMAPPAAKNGIQF